MKKLINRIQFILVMYLLAMLIVIPITLIFENDIVVITDLTKLGVYFFVIKPLPLVIAQYLYLGIKELKHESEQTWALSQEELSNKDKQIANYKILDNARISRIRTLEKELADMKKEDNHNLRAYLYKTVKLLDDIDTTSDIYKRNNTARLEHIDKLHQERFIIGEDLIDSLYDEFYNKEKDILTPIFDYVEVPFNEDNDNTDQIYICPDCGSTMTRTSDKMVYCDNILCHRKQFRKDAL